MMDLLHANKHVCALERANPNPVFILEDDVEFLDIDSHALEEALRVVACPGVDAVALGCLPLVSWRERVRFRPADFTLKWHRVALGATTHAILLSAVGRAKLAALQVPSYLPHDIVMYRNLTVYTPKAPLAGQTHPRTLNATAWDRTGVLKKLVFDPNSCDIDSRRCYEGFHRHLHRRGMLVPIVKVAAASLVCLCVTGVVGR